MRIRALLAAALVALMLTPAAASARQVGHVRVAIDTAASFPDYPRSAQRHGYVILQAWQQDRMRALKQASPDVKVLVYKNLSFASESVSASGRSPSGVYYADANSNHADWFLRNTDGARFTSWGYSWNWAMDVGNAGYQQRWAENVLAELQSEGWDGVFMDDTNPTMKYHYQPERVAKYPNDAAYSAATSSALAAITPRIRGGGKLAVANIGSWNEYFTTGTDWLQHLDGAMDENFVKWGNTAGQGYDAGRWQTQVKEIRETQSRGKDFIGITHSDAGDGRAARYGYATMLLAGDAGRTHFAFAHDYTNETWFPEYDYDLGEPTGAPTQDADGVRRRQFERGIVLVNPTLQAQTVSLGGTYSGSGRASAESAEIGPTSGLVLQSPRGDPPRDGGSPPATRVPAVLAIVKGRGHVELRWTRGRHGIRSYRVLRNGKVVKVTRSRRFVDRRARPGRTYRYRVATLDRRGRRVVSSRAVRIATLGRRPALSIGTILRQVRGSLVAPSRRGWKSAYVERRVRAGGRLRWQRVTRVTRARSFMRLAIRLPNAAVIRLVVRPVRGPGLRSSPFRVGSA